MSKCKGKHRIIIKQVYFYWYPSGPKSWHCDLRFSWTDETKKLGMKFADDIKISGKWINKTSDRLGGILDHIGIWDQANYVF